MMCEYTVCDISHISLQYIPRLDQSHLGTISVLSEAVRLTDNGFQPFKKNSKILEDFKNYAPVTNH